MIKILDIYTINKWSSKKFFIFSMFILILYDIVYIFNQFNQNNLPILQEVFGFLLITLIPGFCILRLLNINDIDRLTNFLFAVGLSLSSVMVLGLILNLILPFFGIDKPMSSNILVIALNIFIVVITIISVKNSKKSSTKEEYLKLNNLPIIFILCILIFLGIFGSYLVTYYNYYKLTLICFFILALIPIATIYSDFPKDLYPLTLYTIALTLLFLYNLVSTHLWSFDIFFESYSTRTVIDSGIWIPYLRYKANSLLLITILAPTYSLICGISYVWVFKIIFPIIFAFTPVALYRLYQNYEFYIGDRRIQIDECIAFLSSLLFVYYYGFFKNMPDKQYIAEFFLILVLISMLMSLNLKKNIQNRINKKVILIFLSFALVTTHYGISYLFVISLILLIFTIYLLKYNKKYKNLFRYILFYIILVFGWYIYVASGNKYETIVLIGKHIIEKIVKLQIPIERSGISYILHRNLDILWILFKLLYIILQIYIFIGILYLIIYIIQKIINEKQSLFLSILSITFYIFLLVQTIITYGMGFDRILQITLTLLSPPAIFGYMYIQEKISLIIKGNKNIEKSKIINVFKRSFVIYLLIFILFNSGFIFKICNDIIPPYCIAVNKSAGWPVYSEGEVASMIWLKSNENKIYKVSAFNMWHIIKSRDGLLLSEFYPDIKIVRITPNRTRLPSGTYIFLGKISIKKVKVTGLSKFGGYIKLKDTKFYSAVISKSDKIYDDGNAVIYVKE